ncbi:NAD(P)-binding protein [Camillea tinctor]|nr:NAD(P)-binding protein [Camillea tinctor]
MPTANPPPQNILIIGAGELGTAILEALSQHPGRHSSPISVLLRASTITSPDPAKQAQNARLRSLVGPGGGDLVPGDIAADGAEDLARTFARFDVVVACAGFAGLPAGTQRRVAAAVVRAGQIREEGEGKGERKRRIRFFPWQWGVDYDVVGEGSAQDLFDEQAAVRRLLRGQGSVDWTIVSTGLFMSFLFLEGFGIVDLKARVVRALGTWDTRVTVTTPRDIGRVVAEMVYGRGRREGIPDGVVYIAGDTVSYGAVADLVERRFGAGFRRELWDLDTLRQKLKENPDDGMVKYQNVFAEGRGVAWDKEDTLNAKWGIEMQDVKAYLDAMTES